MEFEEFRDRESRKKKEFYKKLLKKLEIEEDDIVYGIIKNRVIDDTFFCIDLYTAYDTPLDIFPDDPGWGILSKIPQNNELELDIGDYVSGKLRFTEGKGTNLIELSRLEDLGTFKEKLYVVLKKKWENEGFKLNKRDIAFNNGGLFADYLDKKVEGLFELRYEERINKLKKDESQIEELKKEITDLEEQRDSLRLEMGDCNEELKKADEKWNEYMRLGIILEKRHVNKPEFPYKNKKGFENLVYYVWCYLWEKEDLQYDKNIIRCFMSALRTKQLIVLEGEPGTGKSSMPQAIAHAIGGECTLIQVQANWTDSQDLLGYFNPMDKRFYATKFLDAIEAARDSDKIHFIVLDEMNLAHVEYYFAEMLNYFTWNSDKQGPYRVNLYSKNIHLQDENSGENGDNDKQQYSGEAGDKDLQRNKIIYGPEFIIPNNIRFIGTINSDETTKSLSPKVIDRSCIIELFGKNKDVKDNPNNRKEIKKISKKMEKTLAEEWYVNQEKFEVKQTDELDKIDGFAVLKKIEGELSAKGINTNNRLYTYMRQWFAGGEDCCAKIDDVIFTKLLPLVNSSDNINEEFFEKLKGIITEEYLLSRSKLERINRKFVSKIGE